MKTDLVDKVAWVGGETDVARITGIILVFSGLGGTVWEKKELDELEQVWAKNGALIVLPYYDPWAWMNPNTVNFVDELVDAVREKYSLASSVPLLLNGESMGGHAVLNYSIKTKHQPIQCYANCPVTDLAFHYGERTDLPRTYHASYNRYDDSLFDLLRDNSPSSNSSHLPDIDYLILHGELDDAVNIKHTSELLIPQMRELGRRVTYITLPEMGHCGPLDDATKKVVLDYVTAGLIKREQ